jgi:flavodoxin
MAALVGLTLTSASSADAAGKRTTPLTEPILVAYFSRSGNTRVVAGLLQRAFAADIFEIHPAMPYPEEYLATVEEARQERDKRSERALQAKVQDIGRYRTVFLGFPIWGETAPPLIRGFLSAHDLAGKTLIPFITHGGYGLGDSKTVVAKLAPKARLRPAFSMEADQERKNMDLVNGWLGDLPTS